MNKPILIAFLILLPFCFTYAYFPANWCDEYAKNDARDSDIILIGRVTKLERLLHEINYLYREDGSVFFNFVATITIGKVLKGKGKLDGRNTIEIGIGDSLFHSENLNYETLREYDTEPGWISLANTQDGYDLRLNEVYLLFLNKNISEAIGAYFGPRSGPYSIGIISKKSFDVKLDDGSVDRRYKKYVSMGSLGKKWKKEVPLDEYIESLKITE